MTRILSLAAVLVTALALPAIADDTATKATSEAAAATASAPAGNPFTMETAHKHLVQLGYTNVSELVKDANGKWAGSADKDGKTVIVAVDVKGNVAN
jgi:ABC-type Fe3+-hydroxamate transport system substrate-binding protein